MNVDWVRAHCMALPHTTEEILWGDDLVFKIGGKMYAVVVLGAPHHKVVMSFKCTPEVFAELVERRASSLRHIRLAVTGWPWSMKTRCRAPRSKA